MALVEWRTCVFVYMGYVYMLCYMPESEMRAPMSNCAYRLGKSLCTQPMWDVQRHGPPDMEGVCGMR